MNEKVLSDVSGALGELKSLAATIDVEKINQVDLLRGLSHAAPHSSIIEDKKSLNNWISLSQVTF